MMEIAAIVLISICSYVLILKNFRLSLYVMMVLSVLLHKELFSFYRWDLLPIRAFMLSLALALSTKAVIFIVKERSIKKLFFFLKDPIFVFLFLLWIVRGLSIFMTKNLQASLLLYSFFTTAVLLTGAIYFNFKDKPAEILKYIKFYVYVGFLLSVFGYFQYYYFSTTGKIIGALWAIPNNIPRVGSLFWDVNHYGALLASLIPVLGIFILIEKGVLRRILNIAMFISMTGALLLTNSRTAWIMAFVTLITFLIILFFRRFRFKGMAYVLGALVLLSIPLVVDYSNKSSHFRAVVKEYFHYRMDSFDSHFLLLTGSYQIFESYPILGGGYGSFFEQFSKTPIAPTFFGRDPAALNNRVPAHTIWGELIAETGILGLSTFILFILCVIAVPLFMAINSKDKQTFLINAALAGSLIGWMVGGIFYSYNSEFFWIVIATFLTYAVATSLKEGHVFKEIISFFIKSQAAYLFLLLALGIVLIFNGLGTNHLIPYDEAIYAKIAKNMVQGGEYIIQYWVPGKVWYEKPPLYMWMMSGFMHLLGFTSLAARLPSALLGFGTVLLVFVFGKKLFNKTSGFFSALVLISTIHFLYYSRASMTDVSATFFITLSLVAYYSSKISVRPMKAWGLILLSGIALGLGVMVKGVIGLLPLPIIGLYEIYLVLTAQQKITSSLISKLGALFIVSCVVFLPWHIAMYSKFGPPFLANYIGYHVLDRATMSIEDKGRPFLWYLTVIKVSMRSWAVLLLMSIPAYIVLLKRKDNRIVFISIWALFILLFFSAATSKLIWYIIPIYPALALLVGNFVERLLNLIMQVYPRSNNFVFKTMFIYVFTITSLMLLFANRNLVYTSDLTGSQARLLILKDEFFGKEQKLYADRIELPLDYYYTDGPFEVIDFKATEKGRVPHVSYNERLVLLTKKGRFSDQVLGYTYTPTVVAEDGDYILWYMESGRSVDAAALTKANSDAASILKQYPNINMAPAQIRAEYQTALQQKLVLEKTLNSAH